MRTQVWTTLILGLSAALQPTLAAKAPSEGITDIRITACKEDNCSVPGYRKIAQDLNKYSRGSFVHLHFTDRPHLDTHHSNLHGVRDVIHDSNFDHPQEMGCGHHRGHPDGTMKRPGLAPITDIAVQQGDDAEMGPDWEQVDGNLNDGNRGPKLTLFVKRDPDQSPIDSLVVKYGFDSHAAIGYDRLPNDLNVGTGGQWVHLYYKRAGPREPITQIAAKACTIPPCTMDDSWTRVNRAIMTGGFKRYLYLFYKSIPGEKPITSLHLSMDQSDKEEDTESEKVDTGVRFQNSNVYLAYKRGELGDSQALDSIAIELGSNRAPFNWNAAAFEHGPEQETPNWNAQVIYRTAETAALPRKPVLQFRRDGSFKIVQFADIHMATGPHSCFNAPSKLACTGDINTLEMMERMLEAEKPDLVVFSGDNVDGLTSNDAYATILKYTQPVVDRKIPWTIIFGNHDEEGDLSREEMMRSARDVPYSLAERGPLEISGTGNYILDIHRRRSNFADDKDDDATESEIDLLREEDSRFHLYFLDSGAYSFNLEYPGWDWIKDDQVEWFRQRSRAITSRYHKDDIPNAMAFFHIPIPEYDLTDPRDDGHDEDDDDQTFKKGRQGRHSDDGDDDDEDKEPRRNRIVGDKAERVSTPSYNSGMFEAIFESKDVRATTAGHDHLNDYCLSHRGIQLCYGGGLGYGSYGSASVPRRSRVFEIRQWGDRVDTWKRLDNDEMTLVGQQALFSGSKAEDRDEDNSKKGPSNPRKKKGGQGRRLTDDFFESVRQGSQYVLGGLGGGQ